MTRRTFVKISAVTAAGSILLANCDSDGSNDSTPAIPNVNGLATVDFTVFSALRSAGGAVHLRIEGVNDRLIVVRVSDSQAIALSSICTHRGCDVSFNSGEGRFDCPCHGSEYSESGSVLRGPADQPLKQYTVQFNSDDDFLNIVVN